MTGTVEPTFHFDRDRIEEPEDAVLDDVVEVDAPRVARVVGRRAVSVFGPGVLVSIVPQLDEATPEVGSLAFGDAVTPVCPTPETAEAGASVGAVRRS